jgi:HSP20 family protein
MRLLRIETPTYSAWNPAICRSGSCSDLDALFDVALGAAFPALDVREKEEALVVEAELPGMKKEDISIRLHDGVLTLSGERKGEAEGGRGLRAERFRGRFERSIQLPFEVQGDKVKATYREGVLTVELAKSEAAKPRQIEVRAE